jgi:GrpB-like predicted nucleotidyltransferase (UPF0157 family)
LRAMLTSEQRIWLDHLSNTDKVSIVPFDPSCRDKFLQVKNKIQGILGKRQKVEHRGASSLKISGQDEIDVYVPVPKKRFDKAVKEISAVFGQARSLYPFKRARFATFVNQKHVDVFVVNQEDGGWKNSEAFHKYLLRHQKTLVAYRELKENAAGKSVREYYRIKIEFINRVLTGLGSKR